MKAVMISIQPKWVEKIVNGEKTIVVRKTAPQEVPFKAYIYCCKAKPYLHKEANPPFELFLDSELYKGNGYDDRLFSGNVIGDFICDKVVKYDYQVIACAKYEVNGADVKEELRYNAGACLTAEEMFSYSKGKTLYGWYISDLKIYDKPRELSEFSRPCSYSGLCFSCKRTSFKKDGNLLCNTKITRPPQSWMHVEDLGEEK